MTRKERDTGLDIKDWLIHVVSHGAISAEDMYNALGISRATFYRHISDGRGGTFPNEEEIDLLASGLNLATRYGVTAAEIKVRFGVVTMDDIEEARERLQKLEEMEYLLSPPAPKAQKGGVKTAGKKRGRTTPVKDQVRTDVAPL
jgi:hypothetical protein